MRPALRALITDPRMIAVWLFTAFLVVTFSVVSARPWNDTEVIKTTDSLEECQYFKPDGDILSLNIDDAQVARCVDKIWQKLQKQELKTKKKERKRRRRKNKSLGKKKNKKTKRRRRKNKNRQRRPLTRSGATSDSDGINKDNRRRRQRQRKQRKMFLEQEEFRKWKRKLSVANLLAEPVAQTAINDLWKDLISKGPQWEEIYLDMHKQTGHHRPQTTETTTTTTTTNIETTTATTESTVET